MRLLRHLTAVVLAVAVIAGLGLLWAHAASGGTGVGGEQVTNVMLRASSPSGFSLGDASNLIRTCVIEALLASVVIAVGVARRRQRRHRRNRGPVG